MTIIATPIEKDTLSFVDSLARVRVSCDEGDGNVSVVEVTAPRGSMPPLHVDGEDETFYVLEGTLTFYKGDAVVRLSPGDSLLAPRDVPHTYLSETDGLRMLVVGGGGFERFVRAVSRPASTAGPGAPAGPRSREEAAELAMVAAEHGIEILGPPGMLPTDLS